MSGWAQDLRFAWRGLRRNPAFAVVAVAVLGLGIGANTAIFSVVDSVVLRPLPFADPHELVTVGEGSRHGRPGRGTASWPLFRQWREQTHSLRDMAAYHADATVLTGPGGPELLSAVASTANLFDVLGVAPFLGRGFAAGEDQAGKNRVVVLSHGLWQRRFAADPAILGRTLSLDGADYTIIGVAPPAFRFPPTEHAGDLWLPVPHGPLDTEMHSRTLRSLQVLGRRAPAASLAELQAELEAVQARLIQQYPEDRGAGVLTAAELRSDLVRNVRGPLLFLLVAVGCTLLIACANVANLMLARATARARELAIRVALGAGRGRLARQLLTESALLGLLGASVGLGLAFWGLEAIVPLLPANLPRSHAIGLDGRVLAFTACAGLFTSLAFGLAPALWATRQGAEAALKSTARQTKDGARGRAALLIGEIALSFLLLVGAGLALRSFARLTAVDPGFEARNLLTVDVGLPVARYDEHRIHAFYRELLPRVQSLPGAEGAALALPVPYSSSNIHHRFVVPGRPSPAATAGWVAETRYVSPEYFTLLHIPLVRGRPLQPSDEAEGALPVAVVSESFARQHWPDEDPLGKRIEITAGYEGVRTIVGVVRDVKPRLDVPARPGLYLPFPPPHAWIPLPFRTVLIRSAHPQTLVGLLRAEVMALDAALPLGEITTMEKRLFHSLDERRLNALLLALFAALALVLAAAGIYGVMSYTITQRTRELGVRLALGAESGRVLRLVLGQTLRLGLMGVALGLVAALALSRIVQSQLYGISATDPATLAGLGLLLLAVSLLAGFLPARRATRVDPLIALRAE